MESAALFYNLGSAYFKIGQYGASKKYYNRVKAYPDKRALAEFNLGMIAIKQNDSEQALAHFKYAEANSNDKTIIDASKQTIAELAGTGKRWLPPISAMTTTSALPLIIWHWGSTIHSTACMHLLIC